MNVQETNIKIAYACGWRNVGKRLPKVHHNVKILIGVPPENTTPKYTDWACSPIPDYCNDLNAIHDAEKAVIMKDQDKYGLKYSQALFDICNPIDKSGCSSANMLYATARQRAEAFIKTIDS